MWFQMSRGLPTCGSNGPRDILGYHPQGLPITMASAIKHSGRLLHDLDPMTLFADCIRLDPVAASNLGRYAARAEQFEDRLNNLREIASELHEGFAEYDKTNRVDSGKDDLEFKRQNWTKKIERLVDPPTIGTLQSDVKYKMLKVEPKKIRFDGKHFQIFAAKV